jgi:outer membrane biosynthesis protein TonB
VADEKSKKLEESKKTLTDGEITTERTLGRRSFLTAVGAVVAGGAAALALGDTLDAALRTQSTDPDKKPTDPDKKPADPDKKPDPDKKKKKKKKGDPDKKKRPDPDKKPDPDRTR